MGNFSEAKKRDFLKQLIVMMELNKQMISEKGFNAQSRIEQLNLELTEAEQAEAIQRETMAAAKNATMRAQEALDHVTVMDRQQWICFQAFLEKQIIFCLKLRNLENNKTLFGSEIGNYSVELGSRAYYWCTKHPYPGN